MRKRPPGPEINVTPLVDVVLVLLIIFMVVVPQLAAGDAVDYPAVEHPDPRTDVQLEPLVVSLNRAGAIYLDRRPIERAALAAALESAHRDAPRRPLRIKADRGVAYRSVRELFALAQGIGFPGVGLHVAERGEEPRS
jgi:biopolymer transport protein ExbD